MEALRYSLCPNCDACPEVVVNEDTVLIGEDTNQVRLSAEEWNELVSAIREGRLGPVGVVGAPVDCDCCAKF